MSRKFLQDLLAVLVFSTLLFTNFWFPLTASASQSYDPLERSTPSATVAKRKSYQEMRAKATARVARGREVYFGVQCILALAAVGLGAGYAVARRRGVMPARRFVWYSWCVGMATAPMVCQVYASHFLAAMVKGHRP